MIEWIKNILTSFAWTTDAFKDTYLNNHTLYTDISSILFLIGVIGLIVFVAAVITIEATWDFDTIMRVLFLLCIGVPIIIIVVWLFCMVTYYVILYFGILIGIIWLVTDGREKIIEHLKKKKRTKSSSNNYYKNKLLNI